MNLNGKPTEPSPKSVSPEHLGFVSGLWRRTAIATVISWVVFLSGFMIGKIQVAWRPAAIGLQVVNRVFEAAGFGFGLGLFMLFVALSIYRLQYAGQGRSSAGVQAK